MCFGAITPATLLMAKKVQEKKDPRIANPGLMVIVEVGLFVLGVGYRRVADRVSDAQTKFDGAKAARD